MGNPAPIFVRSGSAAHTVGSVTGTVHIILDVSALLPSQDTIHHILVLGAVGLVESPNPILAADHRDPLSVNRIPIPGLDSEYHWVESPILGDASPVQADSGWHVINPNATGDEVVSSTTGVTNTVSGGMVMTTVSGGTLTNTVSGGMVMTTVSGGVEARIVSTSDDIHPTIRIVLVLEIFHLFPVVFWRNIAIAVALSELPNPREFPFKCLRESVPVSLTKYQNPPPCRTVRNVSVAEHICCADRVDISSKTPIMTKMDILKSSFITVYITFV